jgi:DNA-binding CsgD family transcriptional regulator
MPEIFGRESELEELRGFVARISEGPCALVLEGAPGIGKTTLWDVTLGFAHERGVRVLWCRPAESEARLAYSGWADLFRDVPDEFLEPLPEPQRLALDIALLRSGSFERAVDHRAVAAGTLEALRALADRSPVLVAIDDQQWLDRESAILVEYCARRLRDEPVGFLACGRLIAGRSDPLRVASAVGEERSRYLRPEGLGHDAIGLLLVERLGLTLPFPAIRRIHASVHGNPFFALEVGRAIQRHPGRRVDHRLPVPDDVQELVRSRIAGLEMDAREVVEVASACARPSASIVGSVIAPATVVGGLVQAEAAGIVRTDADDIRFAHPLFAAAAYAGMAPRRRREVHSRLAHAIDSDEERARHQALGSEPPDEEVAATLEATAAGLASRGAPIAAAELFEEAARFTPGDRTDDVARLSMLAADQHFLAGDHPRAIELVEKSLASMPPGPGRAEGLLRLGRLMFYWDLPRAASVLREAEGEQAPLAVKTQIHYLESWVARHRMDIPGALEHAHAAMKAAEASEEPEAFVLAVAVLCGTESLAGSPVDRGLLNRAVELEPTVRLPQATDGARFFLLGRLFDEGRFEEVLSTYRAMLTEARERGDEMTVTDLLLNLAACSSVAGDWDAALAYALEMYEFDVQVGYPTVVPASVLAILEAHRGELESARAHAEEALEGVRTHAEQGHGERELDAVVARGTVELTAGRLDEAARYLGEAWDRLATSGIGHPLTGLFLADLGEALVGLGRPQEVEPLAAWLDEKGCGLDDPRARALAGRIRGLVAFANGDHDGALDELETAVELHRGMDVPFERARTLLVLGTVLRHAKRKRAAREALDESLGVFERLGARPWAERARAELASISGRPAATGELTPTEERVARLAAAGRTNREIAESLFLSVRTVETHLTHAYRKLRVRSRTELACALDPPSST